MKLDWSWQQVVIFTVSFLGCAALVFFGKAHPELLLTPLGLLAPVGPSRSRPSTTSQDDAP